MIKKISIYALAIIGLAGCSKQDKKQRNMDELIQLELGDGSNGGGGTNFVDHIKPIVEKNCLSCHASPAHWNWSNYDTAVANKDKIYNRVVVQGDMPKGGKLTQGEINLISEWTQMDEPPYSNDADAVPAQAGGGNNQAVLDEILGLLKSGNTDSGVSEKLQQVLASLGENTKSTPGYIEDVLPLIDKHCKICHNSSSDNPNWMDYGIAKGKAELIKERISRHKDEGGVMPPPSQDGLSAFEKTQITRWVEGGALENRKIEVGSASLLELVAAIKLQADTNAASMSDLISSLGNMSGSEEEIARIDSKIDTILSAFGASQAKPYFKDTIVPIFEKNGCMNCHSNRDNYQNASTNIGEIIRRVNLQPNEGSFMPRNGTEQIPEADRKLLQKWLDDDTPEFTPPEDGNAEPINIGTLLEELSTSGQEMARLLVLLADRNENIELHEKLDALLNNAGISTSKYFQKDIQKIIVRGCAMGDCHTRGNSQELRYFRSFWIGDNTDEFDERGYDLSAGAVLYNKEGKFIGFRPQFVKKYVTGELMNVQSNPEISIIKLDIRQRLKPKVGEVIMFEKPGAIENRMDLITITEDNQYIIRNGYEAIWEIEDQDLTEHQRKKAEESGIELNNWNRISDKQFDAIRQWVVGGGQR